MDIVKLCVSSDLFIMKLLYLLPLSMCFIFIPRAKALKVSSALLCPPVWALFLTTVQQ